MTALVVLDDIWNLVTVHTCRTHEVSLAGKKPKQGIVILILLRITFLFCYLVAWKLRLCCEILSLRSMFICTMQYALLKRVVF